MNRIQSADLLTDDPRAAERELPGLPVAVSTDLPGHCVFAPLHYEPNYAYPLLVWLHAEGANEDHVKQVMPQISMRNYVSVAPRGTLSVPCGEGVQADHSFTWCQTEDHIFLAQQRIMSAVEHAQQRLHVHPQRVFLAGAGNGGTMAFRVAMSYPERFAGVISLGGAFPAGNAPLVRLLDSRRLPLFIGTSRESRLYPESQLCCNLRLFHAAGMMVTIRQYPGKCDINQKILADVDRWIMDVISGDQQATVVSH